MICDFYIKKHERLWSHGNMQGVPDLKITIQDVQHVSHLKKNN